MRLLEGVQQAINWIAYDLPLGAHAALQDAMKFLLLAAGTGVDEDVAAAVKCRLQPWRRRGWPADRTER